MTPTDLNRFDHPLPILDVDISQIEIEADNHFEGRFKVKNIAGGMLEGNILSNCPGLTFNPVNFKSNRKTINFIFDPELAGISPGETITSVAYVSTNAGEIELPISIKATKMSISTSDGYTIANLNDFYEYALKNPSQAKRIFTDGDFYMLLLATGYEYMEVYETLHKDINRDRAMDNFFVLSGLKKRTTLELSQQEIEFIQKPDDKTILYDYVVATRSDGGYIECPITVSEDTPWLTVSTNKLTTRDFMESKTKNVANISFQITPRYVQGAYAHGQIFVGDSNTVEITYLRNAPITLKLNRDSYKYEDKGIIEVINNTTSTMQVDVFCKENYIRFFSRAYPIDNYGEIPFDIKLSAFMNAQRFFRKTPFMTTEIEIKASIPGHVFKKTIPIIVGEW